MPQSEQCDFFLWADDSIEAAQVQLLKKSSYSRFVACQMALYANQFQAMMVPELCEEAKHHGLNTRRKRQSIMV
jgi:hypothetical protein